MVSNPLAYLLNPITIPAYVGNWIIIPKISFMWFGVETETVLLYILLLNWVAEELQKVVVFSTEIKCKWDLLIKSEDNPVRVVKHRSGLTSLIENAFAQKKEMHSVIFDVKNTHFYKILLFNFSPLHWKLIGLLTCFVQILRRFQLSSY